MTLDSSYLEYPLRRKGMDHDLYEWSNIHERPAIEWADGKTIAAALMVSLEWFPIIPNDRPFKASGHMQTAYPDYRHYTAREYGTRVGFYRLLDAFDKYGIKASIATNGVIAERYPSIIRDIVAAGHEIIAHSTDMNGVIASGLEEEVERDLIRSSLDSLEKVAGTRPKGWMSIDRSQSWNTPRLLTEEGVDYMCDWVNDDLPYVMRTEAGTIVNVPYNHELSDRQIINVQQQSVDSYAEQIRDAHAWLDSEKAGRMLPLHVTPYIMALPYRIAGFEGLLKWLSEQPRTSFLTAGELAEPFLK